LSLWAASLTPDFTHALQGERFVRESTVRRKPTTKLRSGKAVKVKKPARPQSRRNSRPARSRRRR
jgi:hypothetical protein